MPGSFVIRPIEANLTHNANLISKMNPYCTFNVGNSRIKGQICKKGGKHPHWNDAVTLPATNQQKILVELMDKDKITHDDSIGSFVLDLQEVQLAGQVSRWYPLTYKNKTAGEILLEAVFQPGADYATAGQNQFYQEGQYAAGMTGQNEYYSQEQAMMSGAQNQLYEQEQLRTAQPGLIQKEEEIITTTTKEASGDASRHSNVWTEQRQVVEPHTFMKEVEVVETRPALKEIEVMEPVKVVKDVQYTQAVPVKKQVEVVEPQVVKKEVEVIEPRLVTKTIQVVENVPVTKQVEVVEMRNAVQEVETVEPQSFTKQVEVTEYQPMRKQVEVTQPVTLKKAVEFVEPVITTQTVTKEVQQPVIINEEVSTTVGPASVVGVSSEYGYAQQYGEISLSERQRLSGLKRWVGYETIFGGLTDEERLWEQQRLSRLNEQEWLRERERLMRFSEQDRLREQRGLFSKFRQAGHIHHNNHHHHHHRWHGHDNLFTGLNEKERLFEQERINRLSDQEWNTERERLLRFNDQDRLNEQRRLYSEYQKSQNLTHSSKYNPSPNF